MDYVIISRARRCLILLGFSGEVHAVFWLVGVDVGVGGVGGFVNGVGAVLIAWVCRRSYYRYCG